MTFISSITKRLFRTSIFSILLLVLIFLSIQTAHAQQGLNVPIGTATDFNITMQHVKDYVGDKLAYDAAGLLLQTLTTSVVDWINTGFEGSPSFLTNPQAFFTDVADQVTGAFIGNTGVLSQLCSPFSIDIRLSLALGGLNVRPDKRYACTLSSVINNAANSTVNVHGKATLNGQVVESFDASGNAYGYSVDGFTNGDFSQGGWPAFIAMTTEPQNNIYGAYMVAQSDLAAQIAKRQNDIHVDLALGSGFLSSKKCKDVPIDEYNSSGGEITSNSKGETVYRNCTVSTPGSVISDRLSKSLDIPMERLNMADSINKIVSALFSQLVTQVLQKGLASASNPGQGNTAGIVTQLRQQSQDIGTARQQLLEAMNQYDASTGHQIAVDNAQKAEDVIQSAKSSFDAAIACYTQIGDSTLDEKTYTDSQISNINGVITAKVTPLIDSYHAKVYRLQGGSAMLEDLRYKVTQAQNLAEIQQYSQEFNTLSASNMTSSSAFPNSNTDLTTAQSQAKSLSDEAQRYLSACNEYARSHFITL
jgi:hypothetical protein